MTIDPQCELVGHIDCARDCLNYLDAGNADIVDEIEQHLAAALACIAEINRDNGRPARRGDEPEQLALFPPPVGIATIGETFRPGANFDIQPNIEEFSSEDI